MKQYWLYLNISFSFQSEKMPLPLMGPQVEQISRQPPLY